MCIYFKGFTYPHTITHPLPITHYPFAYPLPTTHLPTYLPKTNIIVIYITCHILEKGV